MSPSVFSTDCIDFISILNAHSVKWVIVGGEAVIYYVHIRLTGDVDFFYSSEEKNIKNKSVSNRPKDKEDLKYLKRKKDV